MKFSARCLIRFGLLFPACLLATACPQGGILENKDEHLVRADCDPAPLFEATCGSSNCHGAPENGVAPDGAVDMVSPGLEERLLDQPAEYPDTSGCPDVPEPYIDSENWENSLLWKKLTDTQSCGDPMPTPYASRAFDEVELSCVADWIKRVIAEDQIAGLAGSAP